jgi:hypothetical protein
LPYPAVLDGPLEEQMEEEKERLGFEDDNPRLMIGVGIEMLMHAPILHYGGVAGLPIDARAIVDVITLPLENVKDRAVDVSVLLSVTARCEHIDVRLNALRDGCILRIDDVLAEFGGSAFERHGLAFIHARLFQELAIGFAILAGHLADKDAFLLPADPI